MRKTNITIIIVVIIIIKNKKKSMHYYLDLEFQMIIDNKKIHPTFTSKMD